MVSFMKFFPVGTRCRDKASEDPARLLAPHNKIKVHPRAGTAGGFSPDEKEWRGGSRGAGSVSGPIAALPRKRDKNGEQSNHNQHPVLAVESQKGKMFGEKLQRFLSLRFFVLNKHFAWAR